MKSEVKIILPPDDPENKKGGVFETMIRTILSTHDYTIQSNVNFTGLEIDLLAAHNVRKSEKLYVECKAKEKPGSTEIKNFAFGTKHKKATHGYFIHTTELEHQAAGLKNEIEESDDADYKALTFIGPVEIISLLERAGYIESYRLNHVAGKLVTKRIVALTYQHNYIIHIVAEGTLPTSFYCVRADDSAEPVTLAEIDMLKDRILEIADLAYVPIEGKKPGEGKKPIEVETISEVATGEAWYDYKPTNPQFFVGRDQLLKETLGFFEDVTNKNTERRVFYLEGKSGWGKSSFVARVRAKANSGHNKNKYFVYAVDYRSALSNNFASIAFSKMIEKAIAEGFIPRRAFKGKLKITSALDILSSKEVRDILVYLESEHKTLVLVFDQFEDAFRQGTLFNSFYKLLLDTHDVRSNLVIGFSWKTEINIPADHEAYYLWQQAKTNAIEMKVPEFGPKDLRAVTRQLESEIGMSLPTDFKTKLIEISQGFPWLIKKLCIHVYEQLKTGATLAELQEEDMNIEALFEQDLEKLSPKEAATLNYIAKRAYEGRQYDISETDDESEAIIKALIDKRLVIKSGTKHNIYWDIFRDYLVEGKVPEIGEIYLLRSQPKKTFENLYQIQQHNGLSINQLEKNDNGKRHHGTYQNYFRILKDLGIITTDELTSEKYDDDRTYKITIQGLDNLTEEKFKKFLNDKFKKYAPVLRIQKVAVGNQEVAFGDAQDIIRSTFRGRGFNEDTIHTYTVNLIAWLRYSGYGLKFEMPAQGRVSQRAADPKDRFVTNFPKTLVTYVSDLSNGNNSTVSTGRKTKIESDLRLLRVVKRVDRKIVLEDRYKNINDKQIGQQIMAAASELIPIKKVLGLYETVGGKITAKVIIAELPELFKYATSPEYRKTLANVLSAWAKYIRADT